MKIQVLQENLSKALVITSRFTNSKVQLPVLANVLLKADKNKLRIAATNLEMSISLSIGAKVEKEGEITVPTKAVTDLVSNLNAGQIIVEVDKEKVKINTQSFESVLVGMNTSDFPKIPTSLEVLNFKIPSTNFIQALAQVLFSVSIDETRPVLTGVLVLVQKDSLVFVSTDGFRLSQKKIKIQGIEKDFKIILPKNILQEMIRLVGDSNEIEFCFSEKDRQAIFGVSNAVITSRLIEGEFPDFERIIPKKSSFNMIVDRDEFLRAVKLASVFARDSANVIKLHISNGSFSVFAESSHYGNQKTTVDAKVIEAGVNFEKEFIIAFNYRFLEDFLNSVSGEDVQMGFSDPNAPTLFLDLKDKEYLHIIMPVRMQT